MNNKIIHEYDYFTDGGWKVKIRPVPFLLTQMVASEIKYPEVPTRYNPKTKETVQLENDPQYLEAFSRAVELREQRTSDAILLYGVILHEDNPIPDYEEWKDQIELLDSASGGAWTRGYDMEKERDRDIVFKRTFVLISQPDITKVYDEAATKMTEVRKAAEMFRIEAKG